MFLVLAWIGIARARYIPPTVFPAEVIHEPLISSDKLPDSWDWRDHIQLTPVLNQFLPRWCGSCWANAVTESLSDRLTLLQTKTGTGRSSIRQLSRQVLLDCGWANGKVGSCDGGSWELAHAFIHKHGITDESCAPYTATDGNCLNEHTFCTLCRSDGTCVPVDGAARVYATEFGYVNGTMAMMNEIFQRGPIPCSMYSETPAWHCYNGGILRANNTKYNTTTHVISLLGWGIENGTEYWIGRHSGGTFWGEDGYFRIEKGVNAFNIESHCGWAVPTLPVRGADQIPCEG